jgi:hypothetical protein
MEVRGLPDRLGGFGRDSSSLLLSIYGRGHMSHTPMTAENSLVNIYIAVASIFSVIVDLSGPRVHYSRAILFLEKSPKSRYPLLILL